MKRGFLISFIAIIILFLFGCGEQQSSYSLKDKKQVIVFAAASLMEVLQEVKEDYEKQYSDITILYNFAGSGTLQKQIQEGAPADLFISAGSDQIDILEEQGLIIKEDSVDLLQNKLVAIGRREMKGVINKIEDFTDPQVKKIAFGNPATVPSGKYTEESLRFYGLWEVLEEKYVFTKDVKQTLVYVDTSNVDIGLVYLTDSQQLQSGEVLFEVQEKAHQSIIYPAVVLQSSNSSQEAKAFLSYLKKEDTKAIFMKYGFIL
ncbi:molybdate ABC transporter, periplasmic molybdate-binding protein [Clostridium aceticum]|uniref:Molybdate-binding protein ModA n=1 Tax=Clostridium aceticum TaxID=84022 RepID=A0A0D8ICH0_9CLOT|nr:molybdate ABC transporter substrate-binding protein [Clostridium aceticum]AKL94871.1 molybdate ABC transporter, periplasmic molybdate-binding protein [Clostridium aceticum]KJF27799.1 hypothetical protein TZ02_04140 [Clostridium aceticum]